MSKNTGKVTGLFDTHTHLTDSRFDADRESLIAGLCAHGVSLIMDVACTIEQAEDTLALAHAYDFIYASVGVHPHEVSGMKDSDLDELQKIAMNPKVRAIGEIGLDYHYDFSPRPEQKKRFAEQLELAISLKMPVILHIREAFGDCMDILCAHKDGLFGIMHCFSGSLETAFRCVDLGLSIAFGGALTFKNARRSNEVARALPQDSLLIETDCPYMTPAPHRGKRNDPTFIALTALKLAEIRGESFEQVQEYTYTNACRLFGIQADAKNA